MCYPNGNVNHLRRYVFQKGWRREFKYEPDEISRCGIRKVINLIKHGSLLLFPQVCLSKGIYETLTDG